MNVPTFFPYIVINALMPIIDTPFCDNGAVSVYTTLKHTRVISCYFLCLYLSKDVHVVCQEIVIIAYSYMILSVHSIKILMKCCQVSHGRQLANTVK